MLTKVFILFCAIAAIAAYPYADVEYSSPHEASYEPVEYQRVRRQAPTQPPKFQLQGGGGGSPKQGFAIKIDGAAPVWQSNNGRHEIGVSGGYTQHLGGPYGNSRPDYRVGAGYTYHFG